MKNIIAIRAFEQTIATMIYGILPSKESKENLLDYLMDATAEQVWHIMEEDNDFDLKDMVEACEELAQFFGKYA